MHFLRWPLPALLILLCFQAPARAEDPEPPGRDAELILPPIRVEEEGRTRPAPPSPVTVIRVKDLPPDVQTLSQALALVAGVQIQGVGNGFSAQTVSLRGVSERQVLVTLDGVPVQSPLEGAADLSLISLQDLETIEVRRGGESATHGSSAMGGVIALTTSPGRARTQAEARLGYGSWNTVRAGVKARGFGWSGSYSFERTDGDFPFVDINGKDRIREQNQAQGHLANLEYTFTPGNRAVLRPGVSLAWREGGSPGVEQYPSTRATESRRQVSARLPWRMAGGGERSWALEGNLSWTLWQNRYQDPAPYFPPSVQTREDSHRAAAGLTATWTLPQALELGLGLDAAEELATVVSRGNETMDPSRFYGAGTARVRWRPGRFELAGEVRGQAGGSDPVAVPGLQAAWRPASFLRLGLAGARSFRLPTFYELYYDGGTIQGDPGLKPEDAWGLDLWVDLIPSSHFKARLGVFQQWISSQILWVPISPYQIRAMNHNDGSISGLETEVGLQAAGFRLDLAFTWMDPRDNQGRRVPYRSDLSGSANLGYSWGPVAAWVRARARSGFYLDTHESRAEEGRLLVSGGGRVNLPLNLDLVLSVDNLTDVRDAVDIYQLPLPGLSWFLSLEWSVEDEDK